MKKIKFVGIAIMLSILVLLAFTGVSTYASASTENENDIATCDIENLSRDLFGDIDIRKTEYLYNFDESADYIYVDFTKGGYAIFLAKTLELLEYVPQGEHPFQSFNSRKYYGGPQIYLTRAGERFLNTETNETIVISDVEARTLSQNIRQVFSTNSVERKTIWSEKNKKHESDETQGTAPNLSGAKPPIEEIALIQGTNAFNVTYINNSQYFAPTDPTHGFNNHGTCGSVAAQILLGYNNYYSDRRIIDPEHLNGGWNNSTGNNDIHDPLNYDIRANNPNVCVDPKSMTNQTTGTNNDFYNYVISTIEPGAFNCVCTNTIITVSSGTATVRVTVTQPDGTSTITTTTRPAEPGEQNSNNTDHSHNGSSLTAVRNGLQNILNVNSIANTTNSYSHNATNIKAQINSQRPVILSMQASLGGFDHFVVGYGYGDYTYPVGHTNAGETYSGYIVHFGWIGRTNIWINAGWCSDYITMQINHTHNYSNITGNIINGQDMELRCECGHRIVDTLFNRSSGTITGARYTLTGSITIPSSIGGTTITAIGTSAFANQTQLSQITIPASVTRIGIEAFSPSTVLASFVGNRANIDFVIAAGTTQTYLNNGWTGFNVVELSASGALTVVSGQLRGLFEIPSIFNNRFITSLGNNAFANQTQLSQISIPPSVESIGDSAFLNCTSLNSVSLTSGGNIINTPNHSTSYTNYYYTERSLDVNLVAGTTYTLSFHYYNLSATTDLTNVFTSLGVGETTFAVDLPVQKPFSTLSSDDQVISFTPTAAQLATSSKLWCRFIRTSTPQSVSIAISNVKLEKGVTNIAVNAFTGCTNLASPGLSYRLLSDNTYAVSKGTASTKTIFIPSTYSGKAVTQIDASGFADSNNFKWVFMQAGLTTVGICAFQNCNKLATVDMSTTSVTSIEAYTFDTCGLLASINLPDNLLTIKEGAFIRTKKPVTLPAGVTSIGNSAFAQGERNAFALPDNLVTIGAYAFANSESLILVYNGSSLTTIGERAFYNTPTSWKTIPASVTTIGAYAFCNSSFLEFALSAGSQLTNIGNYAFQNCGITGIVLPTSVTNIGTGAFNANTSLTIYTERSYTSTNPNWNGSNRPIVWGCTLSTDKTYVLSFIKSAANPSNANAANGITEPFRRGYNFGGWYTTSDFSGTQYININAAPNGTLYAKWTKASCVAEGTLITLADGSQVAVEDLTGEEMLLVWNMLTGSFDSAPILFIDSDPYTGYEIIHLHFSDGNEVKVIYEHGFWDIDLNEYVFLRNDAAKFIGHWFNKQTEDVSGNMSWTAVQLVDVDIYTECTTAWSPVTFGHLCYYVNGMLSMPGATEGLINIFEVDPSTMQYDAALFAADIATYGLFTYEEFVEIIPIPEVIFEAFNGQYLKVSIGKGLIDMDGLIALVERYAKFFPEEETDTDGQENDNQNGQHNGHHHGNGHHNGHGNGHPNGHGNGNHSGHRGRGR